MSKLGLGFFGEPDATEMARQAGLAEKAGFESIWLAETRFTRDAITSAAVAQGTATARVGTAAVNVFTRGAALTAVTFAGLDELTGGRAVLGIGAGSEHVLAAQGYRYNRPLARLRERWRRSAPSGGARISRVSSSALRGCGWTSRRRGQRCRSIAVSGPKSLAYAGEVAMG